MLQIHVFIYNKAFYYQVYNVDKKYIFITVQYTGFRTKKTATFILTCYLVYIDSFHGLVRRL